MKHILLFENFNELSSLKIIPDYINIEGEKYSTKNSEGEYISKDIDSIINFYNWFGNSKVIDSEGRPLVVYHQTNNDFNEFKIIKNTNWGQGFYFYKRLSEYYHGNVKKCYLSIIEPFRINKVGEFIEKVLGKQKYDISLDDDLIEQVHKREIKATEKLKKHGYDSVDVIIKDFYVVFDSNNIKSVDNDGSYDRNDNNIYS